MVHPVHCFLQAALADKGALPVTTHQDGKNSLWILKPSLGDKAAGITILNSLRKLRETVLKDKDLVITSRCHQFQRGHVVTVQSSCRLSGSCRSTWRSHCWSTRKSSTYEYTSWQWGGNCAMMERT